MFNRDKIYSNTARFFSVALLSLLLGLASVPDDAQAQSAQADPIMQASAGETEGSLAKSELLATALKREKVDPVSARQAIKSLGELFDFRLSRTGDRYVLKLTNGRKIAMLRYQRGQHVYETIRDEATGEYTARILKDDEIAAHVPNQPIPLNADEDGEIDVEHAAMAEEIRKIPSPEDSSTEDSAAEAMDGMETANPDDPRLPEDPALAGKPSPDAEFPDRVGGFANESGEESGEDSQDDEADDELLNAPVIPRPKPLNDSPSAQETAQNQLIPETNFQNEPYHGPAAQIRAKRAAEPETSTFSMVSMVMFILGLVFMLIAFFTTILPNLRNRKRAGAAGLRIIESIPTGPGHCISCVEQNGHTFLISIHPDTMSFIAPCPPDDESFWMRLKAKTYWYQMAQKPLSDRQITALMEEIFKKEPHQTTSMLKGGNEKDNDLLNEDDSTAILVTSLDDDGIPNEDGSV